MLETTVGYIPAVVRPWIRADFHQIGGAACPGLLAGVFSVFALLGFYRGLRFWALFVAWRRRFPGPRGHRWRASMLMLRSIHGLPLHASMRLVLACGCCIGGGGVFGHAFALGALGRLASRKKKAGETICAHVCVCVCLSRTQDFGRIHVFCICLWLSFRVCGICRRCFEGRSSCCFALACI